MARKATILTETQRQRERLRALEKTGVDVLIVGGGINGAGLFRDLCEQGISCVIIDKNDFGSGTSAAPSRLIHGGLKYLETGEFGLVKQSAYERNLLLKNAPHCVAPLEIVVPIFSWSKGLWPALKTLFGFTATARSRGALLIKTGLVLYDLFGARARVMPRHTMWSKAKALREIPSMTPRIVAAGTYYDARISRPERLVWELVKDGLDASPTSAAMNYAALTKSDGRSLQFEGRDDFSFALKPKIVINAAGPWIDTVNAQLGAPSKLIGGTKGSHIIMDHAELLAQLGGRMIYFEANDGRILLAYPYEGHVMVGATDQKADNPDGVTCEEWEIDYFLNALRELLPGMAFDAAQIVFAYSGIRPLPRSDAKSEGLISRDHSAPIMEAEGARDFPIISLVGGKWTTFRGFAEEVTDAVLKRLGQARRVSTASLAIGGGKNFDQRARGAMAERYGSTAAVIAQEIDSKQRLQNADYHLGEFSWMARNEMVQSLADVVLRRTVLGLGGEVSLPDLEAIAAAVAPALDWTPGRQKAELQALTQQLSERNRIRLVKPAVRKKENA